MEVNRFKEGQVGLCEVVAHVLVPREMQLCPIARVDADIRPDDSDRCYDAGCQGQFSGSDVHGRIIARIGRS